MAGGPPANPGGHPAGLQPAPAGGGVIKYHAVATPTKSKLSPGMRIERNTSNVRTSLSGRDTDADGSSGAWRVE
jgi:hypothetical protein